MLQSMRSAAKYVWILLIIFFIGGFLLYETSGLIGRQQVTTGTSVGSVNGEDITYAEWTAASRSLTEQAQQQQGRSLTLDEIRQIEDEAFEQIVSERLLAQEIEERGITVTDEEIRVAARTNPPPQFLNSPELQTEGRFDPEKYARFLQSPAAQQGGLLYSLEQYYRREIPRQKLFARVAQDVYVTDAELWSTWQDRRDSAQVSYVLVPADTIADSAVTVTDAEVRQFYDRFRTEFSRPGRAVVTVVAVPRVITAADTVAARNRAAALRQEILGGTPFEDVARRESADSGSAQNGGSLPRGTVDDYVAEFQAGARATAVGQISEPVQSPFGFHLIRVDERVGDTLSLRHILVPIGQSDSSATRTDRLADQLAAAAANGEEEAGARLDSAARTLGLTPVRYQVAEGQNLIAEGRYVPDVAAWAFSGAQPGETSDLISADDGYYVARLDSLRLGGQQSYDDVREEIRTTLAREKKVEKVMPAAQAIAQAAVSGSLESAAQSQGRTVQQTPWFTRVSGAPGLGSATRAVGAAFALPVGAVGKPVSAENAAVVMRVDQRIEADSAAWAAQKMIQRMQVLQQLRDTRLRQYLTSLRKEADVDDKRAQVRAAGRSIEQTQVP